MEVFDAYSAKTKKNKTTIKAKLVYHGLEHIGDYASRGFFYLIPLAIIYYLNVGTGPIVWILKLILMAILVWFLRPVADRFFYYFARTIAVLDKEKDTLSSDTDKDVLTLS